MISIRQQIDAADHFASRFEALRHAYLELTSALPEAGRASDSDLAARAKLLLDQAAVAIIYEAPSSQLEDAGKVGLAQLQAISRSNTFGIEERDAVMKEVVDSVAGFVGAVKNTGNLSNANFDEIATEFEALSQLDDVNELRRQLRKDAAKLRTAVATMRREYEDSMRDMESKMASFQKRLEQARKESGFDRVTGLGTRREAEQQLARMAMRKPPVCVLLFAIPDFREIISKNGTAFGDKVAQALAHTLVDYYPGKDSLFRWAPDEFLVIEEGKLAVRLEGARAICRRFASDSRYSVDGGATRVTANLLSGGAEYHSGDTPEELYRRARKNLEAK